MALIKGANTPGLEVKPILPDKHYLEGRISSGDRIVFRVEASTIYFMDVVKHDDIGRYWPSPRSAVRKPSTTCCGSCARRIRRPRCARSKPWASIGATTLSGRGSAKPSAPERTPRLARPRRRPSAESL